MLFRYVILLTLFFPIILFIFLGMLAEISTVFVNIPYWVFYLSINDSMRERIGWSVGITAGRGGEFFLGWAIAEVQFFAFFLLMYFILNLWSVNKNSTSRDVH